MSEHTKEPWIVVETNRDIDAISTDERFDGDIIHIAELRTGFTGQIGIEQEANARRIVACVNACAGFDTELLENILMLGDTLKRRFKTLTDSESELQKQRDELLAALTDLVNEPQDITKPAYQRALAVIASCESAKA